MEKIRSYRIITYIRMYMFARMKISNHTQNIGKAELS